MVMDIEHMLNQNGLGWRILQRSVIVAIIFSILFHGHDGVCLSTSRLSKMYPTGWFGRSTNIALRDVSVALPTGQLISFVGPSGSGKSTLAKVLAKMESVSYGNITYCQPSFIGARVDHLTRGTYDEGRTPQELLKDPHNESKNYYLELSAALGGIDNGIPVRSLRESQRKCFEILLAMQRASRKASEGPNGAMWTGILVLDEYLDKDVTVVRQRVALFLRQLIQHSSNNSLSPSSTHVAGAPNVQVLIVTHSRGVMEQCSDYVIALQWTGLRHWSST